MKVKNHKEFACFDYENEVCPSYQLGDVLFKNEDEPEIGVVIQTFADGDVRTDMWGMCCQSEVSMATIEQIKKYRPKIENKLG